MRVLEKTGTGNTQRPAQYFLEIFNTGLIFFKNMKWESGLNRRLRGVRMAYPTPETERSVSFRLRFRFVRAVRAGEAKLPGRMTSDGPIAGPPG